MTFPSKAFLLTAALMAAARAPFSLGEEIAVDGTGFTTSDYDLYLLYTPAEFLQNNPPSVVLESTFPTPELHSLFESWKDDFARAYKSEKENALRKLIWLENHARIQSHMSQTPPPSHTLAHNDFSDLTNDEFRRRFYLGEYSPGVVAPKGLSDGKWLSSSRKLRGDEQNEAGAKGAEFVEELEEIYESEYDGGTVDDVPEYKNWSEEGAVTKVKNQWFCGACWAFSAIGAIEGARYIKTGNLTELSIQQLIDCDMTDLGCGGGLMSQAFNFDAEESVGLCSLEEYPFAYHRHWLWGCKRYMPYCTPLPYTKVHQYVNVSQTEDDLKAAVATQPVSVAVAASAFTWQFYSGGIFTEDCNAKIDHGVLAVGFGHYDPSKDPKAGFDGKAGDYWLIKNSWGEHWGVDGYMRLGRGTGNEATGGSSCILTLASRPIMKADG